MQMEIKSLNDKLKYRDEELGTLKISKSKNKRKDVLL